MVSFDPFALVQERFLIVEKVKKNIADDADVWLFGSRCDDAKKGGDIDLYIESNPLENPYMSRIYLKLALEDVLGFQKIDLVYHDRQKELLPIHVIAKSEGILLSSC
ncbi:MAG: nucleotidyltransferase domain-containing protein [Gammaproteobacteria bacterium]|nr:nucleotidyltransferase domain-containing protein [Gammaproteobacteria bacterium]